MACGDEAGRLTASFTNVIACTLSEGGQFARLALRYTQALLTQMSLTAVCNRYHSVDLQLCRWLLWSLGCAHILLWFVRRALLCCTFPRGQLSQRQFCPAARSLRVSTICGGGEFESP